MTKMYLKTQCVMTKTIALLWLYYQQLTNIRAPQMAEVKEVL